MSKNINKLSNSSASVNSEKHTLPSHCELITSEGDKVTVAQILKKPNEWHLSEVSLTKSKKEGAEKIVGTLYLTSSKSYLCCKQSNGNRYRLQPSLIRIPYVKGKAIEAVDRTLDLLKKSPYIYEMGGEIVMIKDNSLEPVIISNLSQVSILLARNFQYYKLEKKEGDAHIEINIDPPSSVIQGVLAESSREFKNLKAIINTPTITPENHVINRVGFDSHTGIYLVSNEKPLSLPLEIDEIDTFVALQTLMKPFEGFPFVGPVDKSVCLSAILTALIRPVVGKAPAFAIDAPRQGTGKTYLAQCIGLLATGTIPSVLPPVSNNNDDEVRKRLFAELRRGTRVILWDNVIGTFNSGSLAAFLTSETFTDRVLGKSKTLEVSNRSLLLITGNNLRLAGELPRRVLVSRLDSKEENPTKRSFDFNPLNYIAENRQQLVHAGLTLIRWYLQSEYHKEKGGVRPDRLASFEDWDTLARQVVAWVGTMTPEYTDPKQSIDTGIEEDPEQEVLGKLLKALQQIFKGQRFTAKQVYEAAINETDTHFGNDVSLRELLENSSANHGQKLGVMKVGYILSAKRDRVVDGLKLSQSKIGKKTATYVIESEKSNTSLTKQILLEQ